MSEKVELWIVFRRVLILLFTGQMTEIFQRKKTTRQIVCLFAPDRCDIFVTTYSMKVTVADLPWLWILDSFYARGS